MYAVPKETFKMSIYHYMCEYDLFVQCTLRYTQLHRFVTFYYVIGGPCSQGRAAQTVIELHISLFI